MARRNSRKEKEREKTTTGSEKEKCSCKVPWRSRREQTVAVFSEQQQSCYQADDIKVLNQKQTCNLENFKERKRLDMLLMLHKISMHPCNLYFIITHNHTYTHKLPPVTI